MPNFDSLQFVDQVPDPIWGGIPITALEREILASRWVTRLGHIKQLGLAFIDFPGLTHSRLQHSLGVMHVADQMFATLRDTVWRTDQDHPYKVNREEVFDVSWVPARMKRQAVRIAALLHDLGHPPFSHAVEHTFQRYPSLLEIAANAEGLPDDQKSLFEPDKYSHETFTQWIVRHSGVLAPVQREFDNIGIVDEIADLAIGKARHQLAPFNALISGDFDADRIDYLIRDNRHSGFAIGLSIDELYDAIHLRQERDETYHIYIDRKALYFVNSVLAARERLIERVHLARGGRCATQMLINGLYGILNHSADPTRLAKTIIALHSKCTDYTFFDELLKHRDDGDTAVRRYSVARLVAVANDPRPGLLWPEFGHVSFGDMHPCVRTLAYLAATARYEKPEDLMFANSDGYPVFLEPSGRPSQGSSLLVDYNRGPASLSGPIDENVDPSLDYLGATENVQGRANLAVSLSQLNVYAYCLDDQAGHPQGAHTQECTWPALKPPENTDPEYLRHLLEPKKSIVCGVLILAKAVRRKRSTVEHGLFPVEYLLTLLYCLDKDVRERWYGARSVYIYRGEVFINHFMATLSAEWGFPSELRIIDHEERARRTFTQLQRLMVFGLVETRRTPVMNELRDDRLRATRSGVHSTREDFRIHVSGKHYVEREIGSDAITHVHMAVRARQDGNATNHQELATAFWAMNDDAMTDESRLSRLRDFNDKADKVALEIVRNNGCAMLFSLRSEDVDLKRLAALA